VIVSLIELANCLHIVMHAESPVQRALLLRMLAFCKPPLSMLRAANHVCTAPRRIAHTLRSFAHVAHKARKASFSMYTSWHCISLQFLARLMCHGRNLRLSGRA
jgi:hypothetical protein